MRTDRSINAGHDAAPGEDAQGPMPGRLSIFQRTMLLWNDAHPYNGVHVALVPERLDVMRLDGAIRSWLERAGLTGLTLDRDKRRFRYGGPLEEMELRVLREASGEPEALEALEAEVARQINEPFDIERRFVPFRFFALPMEGAFYFGVTYCHFISDADPVIDLLADMSRAYSLDGAYRPSPAPELYPRTDRYLLPTILRGLPRWLAGVPRFLVNLSRAVKPGFRKRAARDNGFALYKMDRDAFKAAIDRSHAWGMTLNDLFLGALAAAVAPYAKKRMRGKRDRIAVSSIASARKDVKADVSRGIAPFLGSFVVFSRRPGRPFEEVAREVARQAEAIKRSRGYLRSLVDMRLTMRLLSRSTPERREQVYVQNYPLWGGVTSFNLNPLSRRGDVAVRDYFRAVSTGPACPLVLSITTFGDVLNVGVSYRPAVFSREDVDSVMAGFSRCLAGPAGV